MAVATRVAACPAWRSRNAGTTSIIAGSAPTFSLLIYAGLPLLYFLSITVLRGSRRRNLEYADFT